MIASIIGKNDTQIGLMMEKMRTTGQHQHFTAKSSQRGSQESLMDVNAFYNALSPKQPSQQKASAEKINEGTDSDEMMENDILSEKQNN